MKVLDLFSGIGMYALGCEQAGHEVIGFCESDPWARKILKKHWSMKPISSCIKSLNKALIALWGDSPARMSVSQTLQARDLPDCEVDSSGRLLKPFAWWEPSSSSWRTWQRCLIGEWALYSEPWPAAGLMRNGIAYQREALAHPTSAPENTFLPTMGANEGKGSSQARYKNSPNFRGAKMSEGLRTSRTDQIYTNPHFAEAVFGLPKDFTALETEILPASSVKS